MVAQQPSRPPTGYSAVFDFNTPRPGNGLATLIRNDIPYKKLNIQSNLQVQAFRVCINRQVTICNIYIPPNSITSLNDITNIINQLPEPMIVGGDFNSRHQLWDSLCTHPDARSSIVENALLNTPTTLINTGSATHFHTQTNTSTAIDLTMCSTDIHLDLTWSTMNDTHGSDHYPITIEIYNNEPFIPEIRYMEHRANWSLFEQETNVNVNDDIFQEYTVDELIAYFTNHIIRAANKAIPKSSNRPRPKRNPWWSTECTEAIRNRKTALRRYQRSSLLSDKITYSRARAIAKNTLLKAKRTSWQQYINSLNVNTPMSKIWKRIRKIRGTYQNIKQPYLIKDNSHITDKNDVAELLASHYERISSSNSYSNNFRRIQQREEQTPINFSTNEEIPYNSPITILELKRMLSISGNSSPGEDKLSYNMIRKSHPSCQHFLLKIYNHIFSTGVYPTQWQSSIVLSFPKPGKPHTSEENYRPISLTSCTGKLLEKIINTRLNFILEEQKSFPPNQFGFRKMQSTIDALNKFTSDINSALSNKQHTICVSFDLRKAYDTTWRHGILKAIHNIGIRGNIPILIQEFLSNRSFKTKIGNIMSDPHDLNQGVPQGSVLSCTLFSLAINNILKCIPNNIEAILYVDDLLIYCSGTFLPSIERRIQSAINKINTWADNHSFTFSAAKTNCIHFHHKRKMQPPLKLTLNRNIIPNRDSIKYLGIIVDYRMNWKEHIKNLKNDCIKRLDILKCLSHTSWGSDRTTMLRLYRAIIRSKLDYGSIIYTLAKDNVLQMLDPVHNAAIRLCTGAYRSSPVESLYCESGEPSLEKRRSQLLLQYYARTQQLPTGTAYKYIEQDNSTENTIKRAISTALTSHSIEISSIPFKYPTKPIWQTRPHMICNEHNYPKKDSRPDYHFRQLFNDHLSRFHSHQFPIYTDGAKNENGVGVSAVSLNGTKRIKLMKESSIFTAELCGILCALQIVDATQRENFIIFCDSRSALSVVEHYDSTHPLVSKIVRWLLLMRNKNKIVNFCWCPAHVGITGNEAADGEATSATVSELEVSNQQIPYRDWYPIIKRKIREKWNAEWTVICGNKLRKIKESTNTWKSTITHKRKESIILTRLRIGHTKLTHQYLMERRPQPFCEDCIVPLTVKHILTECPSNEDHRLRIFPQTRHTNPDDSLAIILAEGQDGTFNREDLFEYLRNIAIFDKII